MVAGVLLPAWGREKGLKNVLAMLKENLLGIKNNNI